MPASHGGKNRPTVPSRHTIINIHRKIRSITIATYFQSSLTCVEVGASERDREVKFSRTDMRVISGFLKHD